MEEAVVFFGFIAVVIFIAALIHVLWFRWLVIIGVGVFVYIKWINPRIQEKIAAEKAESKARAEEQERREIAERQRKEQEEIKAIKSATSKRIISNHGYELNILPFLNCLYHHSHEDKGLLNVIQKCEENARILSKTAEEINATAMKYNMKQRLHVHSK